MSRRIICLAGMPSCLPISSGSDSPSDRMLIMAEMKSWTAPPKMGLSAVLIFGGHSIPVDFAGGFDSRYGNDGVHSVFPMMFVSIACGVGNMQHVGDYEPCRAQGSVAGGDRRGHQAGTFTSTIVIEYGYSRMHSIRTAI